MSIVCKVLPENFLFLPQFVEWLNGLWKFFFSLMNQYRPYKSPSSTSSCSASSNDAPEMRPHFGIVLSLTDQCNIEATYLSVAGVQGSPKMHVVGITWHNRSRLVKYLSQLSVSIYCGKASSFEQPRGASAQSKWKQYAWNEGTHPCSVSRRSIGHRKHVFSWYIHMLTHALFTMCTI